MTSFINQALLEMGRSMPASIVVKATLAATVALAAVSLAHRSRASVRHAFLAASFGVLAALPIVSFYGPQMNIPIGPPPSPSTPTGVELNREIAPELPATANPAPAVPAARIPVKEVLLSAWLAVAALFLSPIVIGLAQLRSLRRNAFPWPAGQSLAGAHVEVLLHEEVRSPITCGVLRSAIIFPPDVRTWDEADVTRAIVHELEHVHRFDCLTQCLARAVCAVYWFHPLMWIAWRRLTLEAERSCDDAVLAHSEATAYADQLVDLAQRLSTGASAPVLAMANRADLARRVNSVLDGRRRRGRAGKPALIAACCAAAFFVLALSPLRVVAEPPAPPEPQAPQVPQPPILVAQAPAQAPRPPAPPSPASQFVTQTVFISSTALVLVNVTVRDSSDKPVEGLKHEEFAITEDDRPQAIGLFEPVHGDSDLMSYYILGYYTNNPSTDGKFRSIRVAAARPGLRLTAREGYYANPPNAAPGSVQPARVADVDTRPPIAIYKPEAQYSEEARKAKWGGTVLLDVEIDESGRVTQVRVDRNLGLGLDEKAIEAAAKWKFEPALKDGKPAASEAQIEMVFRLL